MMKQYYELKESANDAILFFRMGDFYEIFAEDAELVAPKLELVLTAREKVAAIKFLSAASLTIVLKTIGLSY